MKGFKLLIALLGFWASAQLAAQPITPQLSELPYFVDQGLTPSWPNASRELTHRIAEFALVDQRGTVVQTQFPSAQIRVVNFFFTSCPGICPLTMQNLREVQAAIAGKGRMLSISVTPTIDTPERLDAYAQSMEIDAGRWSLLTGDSEEIRLLARDAFFATLTRNADERATVHTEKAFLIDTQGFIRGVYNATSRADVARLVEDLEMLYAENQDDLSVVAALTGNK